MNTLSKISHIWLSELETRGCSDNTLDLYKRNILEFNEFLQKEKKVKSVNLDLINREDIVLSLDSYKIRKDKRNGKVINRSQSSISSYYTTIKSFVNWCDSCDYLTKNPVKNIKPPKIAKRMPKALSLEECNLLIQAAKCSANPERDLLLLKFGLTMGLRLSEISNIKISNFYPSIESPESLSVIGKGDKERVLPIPESIKNSLQVYLKARNKIKLSGNIDNLFLSTRATNGSLALSRDGVGQAYDKLLVAAGIKQPGLRVHMARHSFATHLLNSNSSDLMGVKELLGHTSVATTQIYLKVDAQKLAKAVNDSPLNLM